MTDPAGEKPKPSGLSNLLVRLLTAFILGPAIIALILWENHLGLWIFILAATVVAYWEMLSMVPGNSDRVDKGVVMTLGIALSVLLYWFPGRALPIGGATVIGLLSYGAFRFRDMTTIGPRIGYWLATIFYVGLLFGAVAQLKRLDISGDWVFLAMTVAWFGDTGAYFTGRFIGGPKVYPAVSPKKTWSGSIGGTFFSVGAGVLAKLWYMPQLGWIDVVLICAPAAVLGQVGDFAESVFKRSFGVKDSGSILPGHGGILDRADALMFVSAYLVIYATLVLGITLPS
jgi:phosphatidate cytidylyltransferase